MGYLGVALLGFILLVLAISLLFDKADWLIGGYQQAFGDRLTPAKLKKLEQLIGALFGFFAVLMFVLSGLTYVQTLGYLSAFWVSLAGIVIAILIVGVAFFFLKYLNRYLKGTGRK